MTTPIVGEWGRPVKSVWCGPDQAGQGRPAHNARLNGAGYLERSPRTVPHESNPTLSLLEVTDPLDRILLAHSCCELPCPLDWGRAQTALVPGGCTDAPQVTPCRALRHCGLGQLRCTEMCPPCCAVGRPAWSELRQPCTSGSFRQPLDLSTDRG